MKWFKVLQTLGVGAAGAGGAYLLHIPAPFLLGPAAAVTTAALAGLSVGIPDRIRDLGFILIGMGLGSGVTPEVIAAAARWPLSLVMLIGAVAVILWGGGWVLRRLFGLDRDTAILSSAPGHLSYVLGLGLEAKADLPLLTVIQSLRVLALTILTPPLVVVLVGEPLPRGLPSVDSMAWHLLIPLAGVALATGLFLKWLRLPAGMLLGAMLASSVGHGTGITPGGVPIYLSIPGFVIMGSMIGTRFFGIPFAMLRRATGAALILTGMAVLVSSCAAWIVSILLGFPLSSALIAFAPGGVETMAAMALMLHADPAYVALHHVMRIFALTFLIPLALGPVQRKDQAEDG